MLATAQRKVIEVGKRFEKAATAEHAGALRSALPANVSRGRSLSAADATFIALAEELGVSVVAFERYFMAITSKAVVPI